MTSPHAAEEAWKLRSALPPSESPWGVATSASVEVGAGAASVPLEPVAPEAAWVARVPLPGAQLARPGAKVAMAPAQAAQVARTTWLAAPTTWLAVPTIWLAA